MAMMRRSCSFVCAIDAGPGFPKTSGVVVFLGVVRGRS